MRSWGRVGSLAGVSFCPHPCLFKWEVDISKRVWGGMSTLGERPTRLDGDEGWGREAGGIFGCLGDQGLEWAQWVCRSISQQIDSPMA